MTRSEAIDAIRNVLNSYPRNGQNGVDCNGWTLVNEVKSSGRMGSTDLFVNKKRIEFLGSELRKLGWNVPYVKYGV